MSQEFYTFVNLLIVMEYKLGMRVRVNSTSTDKGRWYAHNRQTSYQSNLLDLGNLQ